MKLDLLYELSCPKPWTEEKERQVYWDALDQIVLAGASGVGSAAIQIARVAGATVLSTAGSEEKRALARELGASEVFDHGDPDWAKALKRAGYESEKVDAFRTEALSGDYDHVLQTAMEWADVS